MAMISSPRKRRRLIYAGHQVDGGGVVLAVALALPAGPTVQAQNRPLGLPSWPTRPVGSGWPTAGRAAKPRRARRSPPAAIVGLALLQPRKFVLLQPREGVNDDTLARYETLVAKANASEDAFASAYFRIWSSTLDADPPDWFTKLANSGDPWARAQLAINYAYMAQMAEFCRQSQARAEEMGSLEEKNPSLRTGPSVRHQCFPVPRISNSRQLAIEHGLAVLDAKEVEADKIRYWKSLWRRMVASQSSVPLRTVPTDLSKMYFDHVYNKQDRYYAVIAEGLSAVGRMIKEEGNVRAADGIVTLARVSHFWPLPEPAKSLEMLKRHEAKRSEFGGELCKRDNAVPPARGSNSST